MANKIWIGGESSYETDANRADNYAPISVRNATYKWTSSPATPNEFYCELAGGGDPSLEDPTNVQIDGSNATEGTVGALTEGQWDYGDNDTLGYNTIYVRLTGNVDPDTKTRDYVTFTNVPLAGDDLYFEDSSQDFALNLDAFRALTLTSVNIAQRYTGKIGTDSGSVQKYFETDATTINIGEHEGPGSPSGSGRILLELTKAGAQTVNIENSGVATDTTKPAIRLKTTAQAHVLNISKGKVGLAYEPGETAQFTTISIGYKNNLLGDAELFIGSGTTLTTLTKVGGKCVVECALTTINHKGGELKTIGSGAITTINCLGGDVFPESSGIITTLNVTGGHVDMSKGIKARTVTTAQVNGKGKLTYDETIVTVTNRMDSNGIISVLAA